MVCMDGAKIEQPVKLTMTTAMVTCRKTFQRNRILYSLHLLLSPYEPVRGVFELSVKNTQQLSAADYRCPVDAGRAT